MRVEKAFHRDIEARIELRVRVAQIHENGLDLVGEDGLLIYVAGGQWLMAPFALLIDRPVKEWASMAALKEGDFFHKSGELLVGETANPCSLSLRPATIVDLFLPIGQGRPPKDVLLKWVQLLIVEILEGGRFDGMAGVLHVIRPSLPTGVPWSSLPMSLWSRQALPCVSDLSQSVLSDDADRFAGAWDGLLGLGPGLTPGGDDLLVGFLAAHRLFSSPLGGKLDFGLWKSRLNAEAALKTTRTAARFLTAALEGQFAEIPHRFLSSLRACRGIEEVETRDLTSAAETLIGFGHTSGTDMLVGVAIGLWTLSLES
jgi:hypothetical protein